MTTMKPVVLAAVGFVSIAAQAPRPGLCERAAPQIGMKEGLLTRRGADLV